MATATIPNRPAGTDARSIAAILGDFDAILAQVNGNLQSSVNVAVAAAATIDGNASAEGASTSLARADHAHMVQGVERRASDPSSGHFVGRVYFNTTTARLMYCVSTSPLLYAKIGADKMTNTTQVSSTGTTSETNLQTIVIPANTLAIGDMVKIRAAGTAPDTFGTKTIRLYFGAGLLASSVVVGVIADWSGEATLVVTGASAEKSGGVVVFGTVGTADYSAPAEAISGSITVKSTGQSTNSNAVLTSELLVVEVIR